MGEVNTKKATPAMRQYLDIKGQNTDAIIFFRMGDFYEMFYDDAVVASRELGIALTSRDRERSIPMCGVPYHAAASYIARLVKTGHKVAVCEQVEDPKASKGIVERAVTRVITPGIAFDDELLEPRANNFIASVFIDSDGTGLAYMDVTTGEFRVTEGLSAEGLVDELKRVRPLELLLDEKATAALDLKNTSIKKHTILEVYEFNLETSLKCLNGHFKTASLDGFGCAGFSSGVRAAGALLKYIKETQRSGLGHVKSITPYFTHDYLVMDHSTLKNLEVVENIRSGARSGTLLELLDKTRTAMGARRLKAWLLRPLKDSKNIRARLSAVEEFTENPDLTEKLSGLLSGVYDLERLTSRVSLKIAGPRDISALRDSLEKLPLVLEVLGCFSSPLVRELAEGIDPLPEAVSLVNDALVDSPPASIKDGGVIREGYDRDLDDLREAGSGGKDWIARLEAEERKRTGISSLKVGYNRVFGYYIEVTRTNLANVPPEYQRKQTLVNAERFITQELKVWEEKVLTSEERARELESELFASVVERLSAFAERVQESAVSISSVDALMSLAKAAVEYNYVRPEIDDNDGVSIEAGRHPVVERGLADGFVANDLFIGGENGTVFILTGPNMAGKSTYLRQVALTVLMAQAGSFVPAARAAIGVVDRIFTRVGASDDLARGQSTFMVEMNETASILNNATRKSLVILDEIGRGTSTFDGLSIAWAVAEFIHDNEARKAKTLFATHYHELTELSLTKQSVKNYNMAVKEWEDRVIFLRKVVPGGANRSYGIQVARLAGMPAEVVERAKEILKNLESGELNESGMPRLAVKGDGPIRTEQLNLLGRQRGVDGAGPEIGPAGEVVTELKALDIDNLTPVEALVRLKKLKDRLDG